MQFTLKTARVNKGLTQEEAATMLDISVTTLNKYETGKTFPDVRMIKKMESLYELSYNDIDFLCPATSIKPLNP